MADWDNDVGLDPEFSFSTETSFKTLVSTGEAGKERRRSKRSTQRREWKLKFGLLSDVEVALIWDFYLARKGAFGSFTWVDPVEGGSPVTVRFKDDNLTKNYFKANAYNLSFAFIEV
ncbi:DUF2460 domain-containing protein [Candidatus Pacearchaeota archaeon]|nr:DUF2460 domain-containing protein [Candidatus Pacearchaeota archaeon]